ncbi:ABC transporter ATP-binding protein [methanotrophic endosymbiont of Bathymodiolus puteoserpentis (Logatchev)]|jgi:molybdate transport system ATP-binding protein|uniref:ABC transporter ATP-binding protein n=1 Tax=methanotrophic endosymbiont of Bathymodiolus puteoserpentis (Logatchev) TaxID=343235 RepID=UPI0013C6D3AC|nr:ABC transporter ATP-binding protein [methanotrophic endosymbiont of Bathymodiolus puteoserpentis (Logatchev)]SHE22826.1 Molybdenum transport ATP-binding protein ModC (TC 3.A.1.8.1) [methanotrophic endosymbiont of Bathymodiolus puteoserpentis (Logatchev)]
MTDSAIQITLQQTAPIPLSVQLNCKSGELLALVGPSGSGKTTVLRAIAGLYQAQNAQIICQGETWQNSAQNLFLAPHQRHVGLVFQNYALFPHMTVLKNIQQAITHLPKQQRQAQALELLKKVHLEGLEQRYPKNLSGGQQQRVAVARALARQPKVLLLDEPFSAVDQVTRRKLYRELLALRESLAMPMILVTHDLEESTLLADRIALLHKGEILQTGAPEWVAAHPKSATIARLMDQQNLFTAQVVAHDQENQKTHLRWRGMLIEAAYQAQFPLNKPVCWMIQSANILLHRRNRPSNGNKENPLQGQITEYMESSGLAHLRVQIDKQLDTTISINVPLHVAKRNALGLHEKIGISLLSEGIHLMPYQALRSES